MTSKTKPKTSWIKRTSALLGILFLIGSTLAAVGLWQMKRFIHTPADATGRQQVIIIETGKSLKAISKLLAQNKVVTNDTLFTLLVRYKKTARKIQAGEYSLSSAMTPEQILTSLVQGRVLLHRLTIPEGMNLEQTAHIVENSGFGSKQDFLALATSPQFADKLQINADTLEGYLFPETYFFRRNTPQQQIIQQMVHRFNEVYTPQWQARTLDLGFSVHEIVILASIIEKETGDSSERTVIASVFHNRLKRGMRLESDPTVIYGIPDFNGNITRKDLQTTTEYNTYRIKGLPKGPIASPGKLSLEAALFPASTDFLFFVSRNDTTHKFSKNYEEHKRAVRRYQLKR
ncbi:MAG: endolytic transglycosylase MltG [Desulfobacterium sp.]|nr:endolytic transglycosylase MltG [Desulfobacterium sp.]